MRTGITCSILFVTQIDSIIIELSYIRGPVIEDGKQESDIYWLAKLTAKQIKFQRQANS